MMPSYLLGGALLFGMVVAAGFWEVIADSRTLAALLELGVVALAEEDPGIVSVPAVHLFIRSQELIGWPILPLAAALFITVAILKGIQFHRIARIVGIDGSFSQHHDIIWDGKNDHQTAVASGLYIYRFKAGNHAFNKKMILVR